MSNVANIAFHCSIIPDSLELYSFDTTTSSTNTDGDALLEVSYQNINASVEIAGNTIVYCPFVFYSDIYNDLESSLDDILFGINFISGSTINSELGKFSDSSISSFTSRKNSQSVTLLEGQQTPSHAYVINLADAMFSDIRGADLFKVPTTFHQDNKDKSNVSFGQVLSAFDGVWVDINGVVRYAKASSNFQVNDVISNHPTIKFFERSISTFPNQYNDITSLVNELGVYSNLVTNDYSENNIFNINFTSDPDYCYCSTFTLANANQPDLTNSGSSVSDRSLSVNLSLKIT